ncbi:MAG: tRNA lysidine(34) synthetase TilS [Firmicutes bacterium]|nr:tRNA lysidine(34) synthetase TilS [Bacillota bacterium]
MSFISPFYESVKKVIINEQLIKKDDKVVVAVSGGADSLSLLILLNRLRSEPGFSFNIHVAHLNHGLRGESAARDAQFVRLTAKRFGLPCTVGRVKAGEYKKRWGLSPEDAARRLRYRFLQQVALKIRADSIAVGHNRDDQVETVLLNILRGTGPDGLTGMKLRRDMKKSGVILIRPLLNFSRREIENFCRESGFNPRLDETNLDPRYLRNKIRKDVIPYLEKNVNPKLKEGLLRLSRLLTLDKDFWDHFVEDRFKTVVLEEKPGCLLLDRRLFAREHEALQGRMLRLAVSRLLESVPRGVDYRRIRAALDLVNKNKPRGAVFFPGGMALIRDYEKVILQTDFSGENCHLERFFPVLLPVPGEVSIGAQSIVLRARLSRPGNLAWPPDEKKEAYLDFDRVVELSSGKGPLAAEEKDIALQVRTRMPGDRFYPLGAPGKKKLKDYFIDRKISWKERDAIPLVVAGDEIIWVAGRQISHLCRITGETKKILILSLESR